MVKASALYIVIVIALVIGLLCSSLIVAAYFYKSQNQQKFRYDQLSNNVNSGVNILLTNDDSTYASGKIFRLFDTDADSVILKKIAWGIYDVGMSSAFIQTDTLYKIFTMANTIDSNKWATLYLMDEGRPFSLSGKTTIRGDAYIPQAGVQKAYINNMSYEGDDRLILGKRHRSEKKLPQLNENRLKQLEKYFDQTEIPDNKFFKKDSVWWSFMQPTYIVSFKKEVQTIQNMKLSGNIILLSDTTVTIDSTAILKNILVFAKSILVKSGFKGNCQLFATDSIRVDSNCRFDYPSCLGIVRFQPLKVVSPEKITLGKNSEFNGLLFTYEKADDLAKPSITIEKNAKVKGQIYAQGALEFKDHSETDGSAIAGRFLYRTSFTLYENYLINTTIDGNALSRYYLASDLVPVTKRKKKVLQWLEGN